MGVVFSCPAHRSSYSLVAGQSLSRVAFVEERGRICATLALSLVLRASDLIVHFLGRHLVGSYLPGPVVVEKCCAFLS